MRDEEEEEEKEKSITKSKISTSLFSASELGSKTLGALSTIV